MTDAKPAGQGGSASALAARLLRTRWIVRAPIWLYRARLGALLGGRMLLLEHVGRVSGARRYVVLEVADHPQPDRYVVVSGLGPAAQWYRNIVAHPAVRITLGSRRPVAATAHVLDAATAEQTLKRYAASHPKAWARLAPTLERLSGSAAPGTPALPFVALDVDAGRPAAG